MRLRKIAVACAGDGLHTVTVPRSRSDVACPDPQEAIRRAVHRCSDEDGQIRLSGVPAVEVDAIPRSRFFWLREYVGLSLLCR